MAWLLQRDDGRLDRIVSTRKGGELRYLYGEEMPNYQYYIYKIDSRPDAEGEYVGPFATEEERDAEARRLRGRRPGRGRSECIYRANVDEQLADELQSPSIVAA